MSSRIEVSDDEETCLFKKEYQNNQDLEDSDNSDPEEDNLIMGSDEESDSNEEPEEQTFQNGKQHIMDMIRETRQQVSELKSQQKKQRRNRDEQYKSQKKEKIKNLQKSMLPNDVLAEISETAPVNPISTPKPKKTVFEDDDDIFADSDLSDGDSNDSEFSSDDSDFLTLDKSAKRKKAAGGIQTVALSKSDEPLLKHVEEVRSYKQDCLYAGNIKRVSSKTMMQIRSKKRARRY